MQKDYPKYRSLRELLHDSRVDLAQELLNNLIKHLPKKSFYRKFALETTEGALRAHILLDLIIKSLEAPINSYLKDQKQAGHLRAVQGVGLEEMSRVYISIIKAVKIILQESERYLLLTPSQLSDGAIKLSEVLLQGFSAIAKSYLATREELINLKNVHLQELFSFTKELISTLDMKEISNIILKKINTISGANSCLILIYEKRLQQITGQLPDVSERDILTLVESAFQKNVALYIDDNGHVRDDFDSHYLKQVVLIPVLVHGNDNGIVMVLHEGISQFTKKDLDLLNQFLYIALIAVENAMMLDESQKHRQELHIMTKKMITFQEESRKRLASDIHEIGRAHV